MLKGHKTNVSAETAFWDALKEIAVDQETTISQLVGTIDKERRSGAHANLSSSIRLFVRSFTTAGCVPDLF